MDALRIFTIYERPAEYPNGYVVREFHVAKDGSRCRQTWTAPTVEAARSAVPRGLARMLPFADDAPCILETWL